MFNFFSFFLATVILLCSKASDGVLTSSNSFDERILGGTTAPSRNSIASIRVSNIPLYSHICGGFIINQRWVGTAARCVFNQVPEFAVVAVGTTNIAAGTIYELVEIEIHPQFNASSLANDVGLLRTILPIVFTANVQPVIFNPQTVGGGISVLIYGWGRTTATGGYSNTLLRQSFGTITNDVCRERFPYVVRGSIYDQNICTSLPTAATCPGDAGGPIFLQETLIGIISWVEPCVAGQTNVNIRIGPYINWIFSITNRINVLGNWTVY